MHFLKRAIALTLILSLIPLHISAFSDTQIHWAQEEIAQMSTQGILKGDDYNNFNPDANITRAEFIAVLNRIYPKPDTDLSLPFADVLTSHWFYNDVAKAYAQGFANGIWPDYFGAFEYITRQDASVLVARYAN
jgi:hypothetical protein